MSTNDTRYLRTAQRLWLAQRKQWARENHPSARSGMDRAKLIESHTAWKDLDADQQLVWLELAEDLEFAPSDDVDEMNEKELPKCAR